MTGPEAAELEVVDAVLAGRAVAPEHAELAELALLLRAERPEPAPAFAAQLDRRAAAGFPRRSRRRIGGGALPPAGGLVATACLVALVVLVLPKGSDDAETMSGGGASIAVP